METQKILDLPIEILDACFEELLPPLGPHDTLALIPVPLNLCVLMLVCKTFYGIALPWVWRRAQLHDRGRDAKVWKWSYLRNHPEVASHIRFLSLCTGHRTTPRCLETAQAVVPLMENLRFLWFRGDPLHKTPLIDQVYAMLVTKPQLHTLVAVDYVPTNFRELPSLTSLRHLHISGWNGHQRLFEIAPCLESLAITGQVIDTPPTRTRSISWAAFPIPWGNLCELTIQDSHDLNLENWVFILENFSSWRKSFPNTLSPLREFYVSLLDSTITLDQVRVLTLHGLQLRTLSLAYLQEVNKNLLDSIVEAFPQLEELHLFSQARYEAWTMKPSTVGESLGKLLNLRRLHWNYNDRDSDDTASDLELCQTVLPVIARCCKALELMAFSDDFVDNDMSDGWFSFFILRDRNGVYEGYLETEVSHSWRPFTSGWDFRNLTCV